MIYREHKIYFMYKQGQIQIFIDNTKNKIGERRTKTNAVQYAKNYIKLNFDPPMPRYKGKKLGV